MRIHDLAKEERPREKARHYGLTRLNESELLALILGHGIKGASALDIARQLLSQYDLRGLFQIREDSLREIRGLHDPQIYRLLACFELAKRFFQSENAPRFPLKDSSDILQKYQPILAQAEQETLVVVMLNKRNVIIREEVLLKGSHQELILTPADLFTHLLRENAKKFILLHNHPSGTQEPSLADIQTTQELEHLGKLFGITLIDHFVIAGDHAFSFRKEGII